jgi:hypothetical protein
MKLPRRKFLHLAAGAAALPRIAWAQAYPTRPVHLIVGVAAGGGTDVTARTVAEWLSQHFRQQFVVENRTGMAGNLAIRGGPGCLNSFSASISGASARVRLPSGGAVVCSRRDQASCRQGSSVDAVHCKNPGSGRVTHGHL